MVAPPLTSLRDLDDSQLASAAVNQPRAVLTEVGARISVRPPAVSADFLCGMALYFTDLPKRRFADVLVALTADRTRFEGLVEEADVPLLDRIVRDDRYPETAQVECLFALKSLAPRSAAARTSLLGLARDLERPYAEKAAEFLRGLPSGMFPALIAEDWARARPGWMGRPSEGRLKLARVVDYYGRLTDEDQEELLGLALTMGRVTERIRLLRSVCFFPLSRGLYAEMARGALDGDGDELRLSLLCLAMKQGAAAPVTPRLIRLAQDAAQPTSVRAAAYLALADLSPEQMREVPSLNRPQNDVEQRTPLLRASMELASSDRRLIAWRAAMQERCVALLAHALERAQRA